MEKHKKHYMLIFLVVAGALIIFLLAAGGFLGGKSEEKLPIAKDVKEMVSEKSDVKTDQQKKEYDPKIDVDNIIDVELDPESLTDDNLDGIDDFESEYEVSAVDENIF